MFALAGLVAIALIVATVLPWTSSSSDVIDVAKAAAVRRGFTKDELQLRNLKLSEYFGGMLGAEVYVEFQIKGSDPLQTVSVDLSRSPFQRSWQVDSTSVSPAGR
ncbi:MAG: hypothetical protein KatS3mg109_2026 [Pirellulaceae bacterium]|nr:MAG: hypothetical protein KatS3mg109_2026 [Pirellulaceae bacterium]